MTLVEGLKKRAEEVGFVGVGVTRPESLRGLPYGKVWTGYFLRSPEEEFSGTRSVVLLAYYVWDRAFNIMVDSTRLGFSGVHSGLVRERRDSFQLYAEVMRSKAWTLADYLAKAGFDSKPSLSIPLKTSAVRCGLGCQGKNTLLIHPKYGPMVRLISVLTKAELDVDEPFGTDLCKDCQRCVDACPTKALEPYKLKINRCMTYAAENLSATDVGEDVRRLEGKLVPKPTACSYIECTLCIDACPIGKSGI